MAKRVVLGNDRQVARAAIRVALRHLGAAGEREIEAEIAKVVAEEAAAASVCPYCGYPKDLHVYASPSSCVVGGA